MSTQQGRGRPEVNHALDSLLEYLKRSRGFDFTGYKRASLERRIRKRMEAVDVAEFSDYEDYLQVHPDEFTDLFDTLLINVTGFFRDAKAWEYLASEILPRLLDDIPDSKPLRVWSAACASGEEAYTVAILLAEVLGEDEFRRRVKIYATDIDEDALTTARHAIYSSELIKQVPADLRERYFERNATGYVFRPDLRRSVIFGRNDLVQDAPISRVDLLISRNALMYFTPETQARILGHFNFSLNDTGYLFLGKSEMLITHSEFFKPFNLRWRVFTKVPRQGLRERLAFVNHTARAAEEEIAQGQPHLRDAALEAAAAPQLIVDQNGLLASANLRARSLFGLRLTDVGRPLQDLEISYRPAELRGALDQAYEHRRTFDLGRVRWQVADEEQRILDVQITPLVGSENQPLGASITFNDVTSLARLDAQHEEAKRQLETAYEELQSTVEELETTNEELQSTNEELETTNEELQSTNEELETMNEELQSTNDELEAMNEEQGERSIELDRVNLFLEGILGNLGVGVVVLDREERVQLWNGSAFELWGLREEEVVGQSFVSLDIGLPMEDLARPLAGVLAKPPESAALTLEATNRRGKTFDCYVRVLPLSGTDGQDFGAILLMSAADGQPVAQAASE